MISSLEQYQHHLVERMRATTPSLSERVLYAFLTVPRHPFVDHYYLYEPMTHTHTRYEQQESSAWYEQVYSDEALITQMQEYGQSMSSSSQPSTMALMLDALELEPGMRVLEVGTGTGYNAALLSCLVGDPHLVTTVDIDNEIVQRARHALPPVVGEGMTVVQGDGRDGCLTNAPYDRCIVTASAPNVSRAWMDQLKETGMLVCVIQPTKVGLGGMLKAHKHAGKLAGTLFHEATFMPLHDGHGARPTLQMRFSVSRLASFELDCTLFDPHLAFENHDFAFFLYQALPDLRRIYRKEALIYATEIAQEGYVAFRQSSQSPSTYRVTLRGEPAYAYGLWNRLLSIYSLWLHCEQPKITAYEFLMDDSYQALILPTPRGIVWPFPP